MTIETQPMSFPQTIATEWLSPQDICNELQIPLQTFYQWRVKGIGPKAYRLGRHLRIDRRDLEAWLQTHLEGDTTGESHHEPTANQDGGPDAESTDDGAGWLSPHDVCTLLHVPEQTFYQWRVNNKGPLATRVGRHLRISHSDFETWLAERLDQR